MCILLSPHGTNSTICTPHRTRQPRSILHTIMCTSWVFPMSVIHPHTTHTPILTSPHTSSLHNPHPNPHNTHIHTPPHSHPHNPHPYTTHTPNITPLASFADSMVRDGVREGQDLQALVQFLRASRACERRRARPLVLHALRHGQTGGMGGDA